MPAPWICDGAIFTCFGRLLGAGAPLLRFGLHLGLAVGGGVAFLLSGLLAARRAAAVLLLVLYCIVAGALLGCAFTGVVEILVFVVVGTVEGLWLLSMEGGLLLLLQAQAD